MEQDFEYRIEQITEPCILVHINDSAQYILMRGKIRLQKNNFIMTDKDLLIADKIAPLSLTTLFWEESYEL